VLVVEDEFVIDREVGIALRDLGCVVIGPAASGREASVLIERERPDVGLLDLPLGDGDAGPVAAALRSIGVPFAAAHGLPWRT
jgi:DNA-binding response OmpR family regulator